MNVAAMHGFLGMPSDWGQEGDIWAPNLFSEEFSQLSLWECARYLNKLSKEKLKGSSKVLMGYSMGGRIALHMLLDDPKQWSKAVLISTHTGLNNDIERQGRCSKDEEWAKRFLNDPWDVVLAEWNDQEVFRKGSFHFDRYEADFNRHFLSTAMKRWSLSVQEQLSEPLSELDIPIDWVVGEYDTSFLTHAQSLKFKHPDSRIIIIPATGHRPNLNRVYA